MRGGATDCTHSLTANPHRLPCRMGLLVARGHHHHLFARWADPGWSTTTTTSIIIIMCLQVHYHTRLRLEVPALQATLRDPDTATSPFTQAYPDAVLGNWLDALTPEAFAEVKRACNCSNDDAATSLCTARRFAASQGRRRLRHCGQRRKLGRRCSSVQLSW